MRPDSNKPPIYAYCEGDDTDYLYDPKTCIDVPKCPSPSHRWDNIAKEWKLDDTAYMSELRAERNLELERTDKYMILDFPIVESDRIIMQTYRQELRDCPDKPDFKDRKMPPCPIIKPV